MKADPSEPPASFKVLMVDLASLTRLCTCGASAATAAAMVATEALSWELGQPALGGAEDSLDVARQLIQLLLGRLPFVRVRRLADRP